MKCKAYHHRLSCGCWIHNNLKYPKPKNLHRQSCKALFEELDTISQESFRLYCADITQMNGEPITNEQIIILYNKGK